MATLTSPSLLTDAWTLTNGEYVLTETGPALRPALWTWLLCDASGSPLAELTTAAGRTITYRRNYYAEAACTIAHEDDAAALLLLALHDGGARLKCYRWTDGSTTGTLRFNGYLAPFTEAAEEASSLSLVFRSPFGRLIGDGSNRGRFTEATVPFTAQDAGNIAASLINTANATAPTGLTVGAIEATVLRDRTYQFVNVGEAVVNLTAVLDGFDFEEVFTESGSTFNVYAELGQDRPAALFQYGPDTLNNVRSVTRTTQPPINAVRVLGANGLSSGWITDAASIATHGRFEFQSSASDVTEQATLESKAQALLRPAPIKTVQFTPELGLENCPAPFDAYNVGDTVRFYARRDSFTEDVSARIDGFRVAISEDGYEESEISDPSSADSESVIGAVVAVEVVE